MFCEYTQMTLCTKYIICLLMDDIRIDLFRQSRKCLIHIH